MEKGGRRMCHFLKPKLKVKGTQLKKSYRSEILHGSCFIEVQYGTVKKRRRNRRNPPFPAEILFAFSRQLALISNFKVCLTVYIPAQMTRSSEGFLAKFTLVWFVSCMYSIMVFQPT